MSRIETRFASLRAQGRCALIPYITAGDPAPALTVPLLHELVAAGADLLELGVPFSDPMADGPVIQAACERALRHGVTLAQVLDLVREFRTRDATTPVVLMGYLNPVEAMGYAAFAAAAAAAGVDGVLHVDLPPEEAGALEPALRAYGIDSIYLLAPTTSPARMASIARAARGFLYYVSLKGVTGSAKLDVGAVARQVGKIREVSELPVGVGFGVRDAAAAGAIAAIADAVVVGTAPVRLIAEHAADATALRKALAALIGGMRTAMDAARSAPATARATAAGQAS